MSCYVYKREYITNNGIHSYEQKIAKKTDKVNHYLTKEEESALCLHMKIYIQVVNRIPDRDEFRDILISTCPGIKQWRIDRIRLTVLKDISEILAITLKSIILK